MKTKRIIVAIMFCAVLALAVNAHAAFNPLGGEFQINTTTTGNQENFSVGTDDAGNFVAVWRSPVSQTCDNYDIFFQRFDSNGNKMGGEVTAQEYINEEQRAPNVAMDADGDFVIVWYEGTLVGIGPCPATNPDGSGSAVYAQRYFANGTANGTPIQVNTTWYTDQLDPIVAMNSAGDFAVVWRDINVDPGETGFVNWDVYAQLFDSAGNKIGSEQFVNQTIIGNQWDFDVSINDSRNWIVVWRGPDGDQDGVFARRFDSSGNPIDGEWRINQDFLGWQMSPAVKMFNDDSFVITWTLWANGGDTYFQRFNTDGSRIGAEILAHAPDSTLQNSADIDADKISKNFFIVWINNDSNTYGVGGNLYEWLTGNQISSQLQINTTQVGDQEIRNRNSIAFSSSGLIVVVWQDYSGTDGNGYGGFGQRYQLTVPQPPTTIPTLSEYGMITMAIILMLIIIFNIRAKELRRRKTES